MVRKCNIKQRRIIYLVCLGTGVGVFLDTDAGTCLMKQVTVARNSKMRNSELYVLNPTKFWMRVIRDIATFTFVCWSWFFGFLFLWTILHWTKFDSYRMSMRCEWEFLFIRHACKTKDIFKRHGNCAPEISQSVSRTYNK